MNILNQFQPKNIKAIFSSLEFSGTSLTDLKYCIVFNSELVFNIQGIIKKQQLSINFQSTIIISFLSTMNHPENFDENRLDGNV